MIASIEADFGAMSILINNAGIASRGLSVADTDPAEVDKLFAVHAAGPHRLSRLALPQLRQHKRSDIIIISSIATLGHAANGAPYNMARSEEHTSELQSLMRISYAVFCLKKKTKTMSNTH